MSEDRVDTVSRVQFDEAGDGVELFLSVADCRRLCNKYGEDYASIVETKIKKMDFAVMDEVISLAAKKRGKPFPMKLDAVEISLETIRGKLLDCYAYAMGGVSYVEYVKKTIRETRKFAEEIEAEMGEKSPPFPAAGSEPLNTERQESALSQEIMNL